MCVCYESILSVYNSFRARKATQVLGKLVFGSIAPVRPRWHPRSAYGFGQGTNETLTPLVPHKSRCAGMTPCGGANLRRRRCWRPRSGDEGPRGPGAVSVGRGYHVRDRRRCRRSVCGGSAPRILGRRFVTEGATARDTWPPPTCKVSSGRGRDKGGRV
jgi:hypothetical protein